MTDSRRDIAILLKTYFTAGVTPEFAQNRKDADVLKGGLKLYRLCVFFKIKTVNNADTSLSVSKICFVQ